MNYAVNSPKSPNRARHGSHQIPNSFLRAGATPDPCGCWVLELTDAEYSA
jgi:hypothetical protein